MATIEFTASTLAGFLKGEIVGNPDVKVNTIAEIEEGHEGALSFLSNPKYEPYIYSTKSSIVLVNRDFKPSKPVMATLIKVDDSYKALALLLALVEESKPKKSGIHSSAVIEPGAMLGKDIYIGALAYIGENCEIGDGCNIYPHVYIGDRTTIGNNCIIYAGVKIYNDCRIGNHCTLHAGSVFGSDGFGFAPQTGDEFVKIPQTGNVILEDNVEVGANAAIDRATIGSTIIRTGVKIDNLVQIGHNVEIGENTVMAGQSGIAGSTKIGKNCMIAGQAGVTGHVKVANGVKIGAQAGVIGEIREENSILLGMPAIDYRKFRRASVIFKNLPELESRIRILEKEIGSLKHK